jgi:hypothetical protein
LVPLSIFLGMALLNITPKICGKSTRPETPVPDQQLKENLSLSLMAQIF